jgi:predicted Rossmann fold flavoprotein
MQKFDLIIIGAGAAGLMCAGEANKRGRRVLVLDHSEKVGEKIRISGGGRANFTNLHTSPANFLSDNPHFCVSALKRFSQHDFITLVEKHKIEYHERDYGQLFCLGSALQITGMLLDEADGVTLQTKTKIASVTKAGENFSLETNKGNFRAGSLVIATGGISIPKMGATGFGYDIAKQFDIKVIEPRAGLVPLTFDAEILSKLEGLAGISLKAMVKLGKVSFSESLLFTHKGISGPVILQISSYWKKGDVITIDLLPGIDAFQFLKKAKYGEPKKKVGVALSHLLPKRLAQRMIDWADCEGRLAETSDKSLQRLANQINAWVLVPSNSEGLRTAEVTVGGVDTKELSSKTMEAIAIPGLYFIGEVVDVTGHLGGFNFQWAWASGHACGQVA